MRWASDLSFAAGEGPRLSPPLIDAALASLEADPSGFWSRSIETVEKVKAALPPETTLLGFAGSPWTVATYMVAGRGSRDQTEARCLAYRDPRASAAIVDAIAETTIDYLVGPGRRPGAEAVQLFDSWAGSLAPGPVRTLGDRSRPRESLRALKRRGTRSADHRLSKRRRRQARGLCARDRGRRDRARRDGRSGLGGRARCPRELPVQGNLDPLALLAGGAALERRWGASYLAFAGGRISSTSAMASSRRRRSPMSSSCSNWSRLSGCGA